MYGLIVFDLDGTLVDSLEDLAISTNKGLEAVGLPAHPVEAYKKFVGNGRDKLVERAMGENSSDKTAFETVRRVFDSYYAEHCNDHIKAYDGCEILLEKLSSIGIKTAVLSNKPDEFVARILKKTYPNHSFSAAWGKRPEFPTKPDRAAFDALLKELEVERKDCLYIGDSDVDVFTAQNAEVDMIGVGWGFRGRAELLSAGAKFVANNADEILEYING